MSELRIPKISFTSTPDGTRLRGRPRKRYGEMLKEDFKILKINNWQAVAQNRTEWRKVVWEAQTRQS